MHVLVAGAGAIGQWVGGRLWEAGHQVTLWTSRRHVDAFAAGGLCVRGASSLCWEPDATSDPASLHPGFDAVLLTCKAHHTQHLAPQVARLAGEGGAVVSLQNGFGNGQKLCAHLPPQRIALALTSHGISIEEPGQLTHAGTGATLVGPALPDHPGADGLALRLLQDAALDPEAHPDLRPYVWRKALVNHALNPVAALHGVPNGELLARPDLHGLSHALLHEGTELAAKGRVPLPPGDLHEALDATLRHTAANRCSMLQDVLARRATEIETITGRLVRLAGRLLAPAPRSEAVYGRVKDLEAGYLGAEAARQTAWDELPWEQEPF